MPATAGDILTYDGSIWTTGHRVQGPFGIGTADPNSLLHVDGPIAIKVTPVTLTAVNSPYPVGATDSVLLVTHSSGAVRDIKLPAPDSTNKGRLVTVKWVAGSSKVRVIVDGTGTIDGSASWLLNVVDDFIGVVSNGDTGNPKWFVVAVHPS